MKAAKYILLIILSIVYLGNCYSRLVYAPPVYAKYSIGNNSDEQISKAVFIGKSLIPHRRHIPLVKSFEFRKLVVIENIGDVYFVDSNTIRLHIPDVNIYYKTPYLEKPSNKAPPALS